jgi:16S rRNA (uracil1498-N3)-methyltransferase
MELARFFCPMAFEAGQTVALPSEVTHHIRVRRIRVGESITLFDGHGRQARATLQTLESKHSEALISESQCISRELDGKLTLIQGLASQDRMDWATEKAVELGIHTLIPTIGARSVVKLDPDRAAKRSKHWEKLVQSASEQCGRNHLMTVAPVSTIDAALESAHGKPILLCALTPDAIKISDAALIERIDCAGAASLMVGPEGGWDGQEIAKALKAGAIPITLGKTILRTETAGLAAAAALSALLKW